MTLPQNVADRSLYVPAGHVVKSGYVAVDKVRLANRSRMAVGDVEAAYRKVLQNAPGQIHPTPNGFWEGDTFTILDGRHAYVAMLMLGYSHILVTWIRAGAEEQTEGRAA